MSLPTPFKVGVRTYSEEAQLDAHGNPIEGWSDPVDHPVHGWSVPSSTEPKLAGHDRVVVLLELLVPVGFPVAPADKVVVPGRGELDVLGEAEDYNHGPFGFRPGLVVNLGKVDG